MLWTHHTKSIDLYVRTHPCENLFWNQWTRFYLPYFNLRNTGVREETIGSAAILNTNEPAKLLVTFQFGPIKVSSDYWVLETDYNTYSLVYSCRSVLGNKSEFAWILSRRNTLSQDIVNNLRNKLTAYGIDVNQFLITDQSNCP